MFHSNVTYVLIPFHMRFSKRGQRWGQNFFFSKPLQKASCDLEDLKIVIHLSHLTKFFSYRFLDSIFINGTQCLYSHRSFYFSKSVQMILRLLIWHFSAYQHLANTSLDNSHLFASSVL